MKKSTKKSLLIILVATFTLALSCLMTGCLGTSLARKLDMPLNVIIEIDHSRANTDYIIKWDAVEDAEKYRIVIDGVEVESKTNSLTATGYLTPGIYSTAYVQAVGNGFSTADSDVNKAIVNAEIVSQALVFQKASDGKTYSAISYAPEKELLAGKIVFPDYYNGEPVTEIGDYAFCDQQQTWHNPQTGQNCNTYTSNFRFPKFLQKIGEYAFAYCTVIKEVKLPETVTEIGNYAFCQCIRLTSANISNVNEIGAYAFYGCKSLSNVQFSDNIEKLELCAFDETAIATSATGGDVILNGNILYKHVNASEEMTEYRFPEGITAIAGGAFMNDETLFKIKIPDGTKLLGSAIFYGCTNLMYANLPAGIDEIPDATFYYCSRIGEINIPETVTRIGDYAFFFCDSLCDATDEDYFDDEDDVTEDTAQTTNNTIDDILDEITKEDDFLTLPEGLTYIGDYAFAMCVFNTKIPSTVTHIGAFAFAANKLLTNVTIPEGVTEIPACAFYGCSKLKYIVLPKSLRTFNKTSVSNAYSFEYILYAGSKEGYEAIAFTDDLPEGLISAYYPITVFNSATAYYYSETEPSLTEDGKHGNYWRYIDGTPTSWDGDTFTGTSI